MNNVEEMSTNINDLNTVSDMQKLGMNIQNELSHERENNEQQFNDLQQMQQQQLLQLQQMQQQQQQQQMQQQPMQQQMQPPQPPANVLQPQYNINNDTKTKIIDLLQEPAIIFLLFVIVSHPSVHNMLGKYVPKLKEEENCSVGILNLVVRATLLSILFFSIKLFILK